MGEGADGARTPPRQRRRLSSALLSLALDPGVPQSVPFDYSLFRLAQKMNVPPWVMEGYAADRPPLLWLVRVVEFNRMENSVRVRRG